MSDDEKIDDEVKKADVYKVEMVTDDGDSHSIDVSIEDEEDAGGLVPYKVVKATLNGMVQMHNKFDKQERWLRKNERKIWWGFIISAFGIGLIWGEVFRDDIGKWAGLMFGIVAMVIGSVVTWFYSRKGIKQMDEWTEEMENDRSELL